MLSGLTPPVPPGLALKAFDDFAIGLGRQLRHQHLDALVLGLEPGERFGSESPTSGVMPTRTARREDRSAANAGSGGDKQGDRGEKSR